MWVGLTGGIASGKSTVARMLAARGARVIDADQVARDVVAPGTPGLAAVVEAFGAGVLTPGGELDRAALGARVFADPLSRRRLEGILHPRIAEESMRRLGAALAAGPPLVVYDASLLIESGRADLFRPLVVVTAPVADQIARLERRDGLSRPEAEQRLAAQMPTEQKAALADHVIDNRGDLPALEQQVDALWRALVPDAR